MTAALVGQAVINKEYQKKRIKIAFNPLSKRFEVANPAIEKDVAWITDISQLFKASFDPWSFVDNYAKQNDVSASEINAILAPLLQIKANNIGIIELSSSLEIETVTEIFTRINSKGVNLSQADFVMSKIASNTESEGVLIRKTIDYFCHLLERPQDFENISSNDRDFSSTEYFSKIEWVVKNKTTIYIPKYTDILRVIFTYTFHRGKLADFVQLLTGRDFKSRTYLKEIEIQTFEQLKEGLFSYCNKTNFQGYLMILESIGIVSPKFIQSKNVLNFGYILYLYLKEQKVTSKIVEQTVRRWVLLSFLTQRYSSSSESKFDEDIRKFVLADSPLDVIDQEEKGVLSDAFWETILVDKLTTAKINFAFYAYLMAQIKDENKGFLSDEITIHSMHLNYGDIHHIFPKNYLKKKGINKQEEYEMAKRFDYTIFSIEYAKLATKDATRSIKAVMETATNLAKKGTINAVKEEKEHILEAQKEEFWQTATIQEM